MSKFKYMRSNRYTLFMQILHKSIKRDSSMKFYNKMSSNPIHKVKSNILLLYCLFITCFLSKLCSVIYSNEFIEKIVCSHSIFGYYLFLLLKFSLLHSAYCNEHVNMFATLVPIY